MSVLPNRMTLRILSMLRILVFGFVAKYIFGFFYIGNQQSAEVLFRARLFSFSLRNWRRSASQRVESESVLCYSTWDLRKISYIVPPRCVSQRGATD